MPSLVSRALVHRDTALALVHHHEVVADVQPQRAPDVVARAQAEDVAVTARQHRRAAVLGRGVHVVDVAAAEREVVCHVVLKADREAPDVVPLERQIERARRAGWRACRNLEADRVHARPLRPGRRKARVPLLVRRVPVEAGRERLRQRQARARVAVRVGREEPRNRMVGVAEDRAVDVEVALDIVLDLRAVDDAEPEAAVVLTLEEPERRAEVVAHRDVVAVQLAHQVVAWRAVMRTLLVVEGDVAHLEARRDRPPVGDLIGEVRIERELHERRLRRVARQRPVRPVSRAEAVLAVGAEAEVEIVPYWRRHEDARNAEEPRIHVPLAAPVHRHVRIEPDERRADHDRHIRHFRHVCWVVVDGRGVLRRADERSAERIATG